MNKPEELSQDILELRRTVDRKMEEMETGNRSLSAAQAIFARWLAIAYGSFHLYTAFFGQFPPLIQRSLHVGGGLMLAFLLYGRRRALRGQGLPWYEWFFIAVSAAIPVYVIFNWERWRAQITNSNLVDLTLAVVLILVVLEAARRLLDWPFPTLAILFIGYAAYGQFLPSPWQHAGFRWRMILENLFMSTEGIYGTVTGITSTVVAGFIVFGVVLALTGGGKSFMDIALLSSGRSVGGPAKVAVISSALFGTISGSAAANVAVTGSFTIPMMRRLGYGSNFAGAVEATASSGGQIMPPIMGAGAFIMAELLGVSYLKIAGAAVVPALLFFLGVFTAIHFESVKLQLRAVPEELLPRARQVFTPGNLIPLVVPVIALLWLMALGYTAMLAAATVTVLGAVLYLLAAPRELIPRLRRLVDCLEAGGYALVLIAVLAACAQIIVGVIGFSGFGVKLSILIMSVSGGQMLVVLLLAMLVSLILGMGMPTVAAYLLAAAVLSPLLTTLGVTPIAAHLFLFYYAIMSTITPPVCSAVFIAAGMARGDWAKTAWIAIRLGVPAFIVPFMFVFANELLLMGRPEIIALAVLTSMIGTMALAAGVMGHMFRRNSWWETVLLIGGSLALIRPGALTDLIGLVSVGFVVLRQYLPHRRLIQGVQAAETGPDLQPRAQ